MKWPLEAEILTKPCLISPELEVWYFGTRFHAHYKTKIGTDLYFKDLTYLGLQHQAERVIENPWITLLCYNFGDVNKFIREKLTPEEGCKILAAAYEVLDHITIRIIEKRLVEYGMKKADVNRIAKNFRIARGIL